MIKKQLIWWVILAILIIVGLTFLGDEHGHVMLVRYPYRVQLSFNLLLVLIVVGLVLFYYLMRLIGAIKRMPSKWQTNKTIKQLNQQQALLIEGVQALVDDQPEKAKMLLQQANKQSSHPSITDTVNAIERKHPAVKELPQDDG